MIVFHHKEFELTVREELKCFDCPIDIADLKRVETLDCSNFDFLSEDLETLEKCTSLKNLAINIGTSDLSFLSAFSLLESLDLEIWNYKNSVDFRYFTYLQNLKSLTVSGGVISSMELLNTDALTALEKLVSLTLHEFGSVDLSFLEKMSWLKRFYCGYANEVNNAAAIGKQINLQELTLIDIQIDDLAFLDNLPDSMIIDLDGIKVDNGFDPEKLRRFRKADFEKHNIL